MEVQKPTTGLGIASDMAQWALTASINALYIKINSLILQGKVHYK